MSQKAFRYLSNFILPIFLYLFIFIAALYRPHDPDLGWYLKYGEYFFKYHHILRDNILSTTMTDYHWVNHSWFTDIVQYAIYKNFGFFGLSIVGAAVITMTFFFLFRAFGLTLWDQILLSPLLLYFESAVNSTSLRAQLFTFLFLSILFYLLNTYKDSLSKKLFFIPLLFLVWANMHGEFILGIALFFIWIFVRILVLLFTSGEERKYVGKHVLFFTSLFVASILVSLINPFGIGVYVEALKHGGSQAQKYILEWIPFPDRSNLWWNHIAAGCIAAFGATLLFFGGLEKHESSTSKKTQAQQHFYLNEFQEKLPIIVIAIALFALTFFLRRYAWPMYYFLLILFQPVSEFFNPKELKKGVVIFLTIILILSFVAIYFIKKPFKQYYTMSWDVYCHEYMDCSKGAADFLLKQHYKGKLLTLYNWGGWLIWNYPQIKPTVDGRMTLWQDEKGYSAFIEYYKLEQNLTDIEKTDYDVVFFSTQKPLYNRLLELSDQGKWNLVYRDQSAAVFVKNKK